METITIPFGGVYIETGGAKYHLSTDGELVKVRLVDTADRGTPELWVTMPAGNAITIMPGDKGEG